MASSEFIDRISRLSQKQLALLTLELQQKLERQSQNTSGPIAVVGMAVLDARQSSPTEVLTAV